ncbi:alpha/beta fold hydrolase [Streptomyces roseoverticillatus]|uniref:alpha/beta fold hydrolase n=1 Tax=Streptomyces roseoverticillatus TaxID=66429 RepID=UPI0004BEF975|nr:alpha/beta hydrolase [Streptomyces roseoverticillatus]
MNEPADNPAIGTLDVPGATLRYEKRGSGPVLLLIPGAGADAGLYAAVARILAAHYTVVSYDPRGVSRSPLHGPLTDQQVEVWSDDAYRLLELLSPDAPAAVLGCSAGAIAAIGLLARHPERVHRVIAHEPPLVELLEDPAPHRALFAEVRETFRTEGVGPAMARFNEGLGDDRPAEQHHAELPPEIQEMAPRMYANLPGFLEHILCPFTSWVPDLDALRPSAGKLVPAAGAESREQMPLYGPAARLAELLGSPPAEFPGGHLGVTTHPAEFAGRLLAALAREPQPAAV